MPTVLIEGCAVATLDAAGTEHADGHVVITDGRIAAVGPGPAPDVADAQRIDGRNCLLTPGFVNTHHHLYQWLTRGYAPDGTLFEWLTTLYPVWAHIDAESEYTAASAGLAALALSGCTTAVDHHYVFPASAGDLLASEIEAARRIGLRFHPARGAMNLGSSSGGLPPDSIVEDHDAILAACEAAVTTYHDARFDSMLRIAIAPCSPFTATRELMRDCADLARRLGVRLHTHLAETTDEEEFCLTSFGARPVDYIESLGWLGADVWLAHCVHVSAADIAKYAATGTGTAHCPSSDARLGSGIAPVPELLAAGARSDWASTAGRPTSRAPWRRSCTRRCWSHGVAVDRARSPRGTRSTSQQWRSALPRPRDRDRLGGSGQARRPRVMATRRPRAR